MATTASLYHPRNDSLEERVHGYQLSLDALRKIEASQALSNNREWAQTLGDENELASAYSVCRGSLDMAIQSIEPKEIQQALLEGLLNNGDSEMYEIAQRKQQIEKSRDQFGKSNSKGHDIEPD